MKYVARSVILVSVVLRPMTINDQRAPLLTTRPSGQPYHQVKHVLLQRINLQLGNTLITGEIDWVTYHAWRVGFITRSCLIHVALVNSWLTSRYFRKGCEKQFVLALLRSHDKRKPPVYPHIRKGVGSSNSVCIGRTYQGLIGLVGLVM